MRLIRAEGSEAMGDIKQGRDVAYELAEHAARVRTEDLPGEVVEITKRFILDTLGTLLAGSSAPGCGEVAGLVREWGGKPEATVLVYGDRVPAHEAAFINAMMAHARDFDDTDDRIPLHANVAVLPACLAVAEQRGGVRGRDLLLAQALGVDLSCRLGLAVGRLHGWHLTATCGAFGATAAVARLAGLDAAGIRNAMGIVYSQVAGTRQASRDGALTKRMQPGFSARNAVLAVRLGQVGITGPENIFEGKWGYFPLYEGDDWHPDRLLDALGRRFEGTRLSAKPYPCCRLTHPAIDLTLALIREEGVRPPDVETITVTVPRTPFEVVGRPFELRADPQVSAQFSIAYTVAVALHRGDVFISDFEPAAVVGADEVLMRTVREQVRVVLDETIPDSKAMTPVTVTLHLRDGRRLSRTAKGVRGDPDSPLTQAEFEAKFRKCARLAARPVSDAAVERAIALVGRLEPLSDVQVIADTLVGGGV
jgi:2-methylcitrate dehydratase PrpD